MTTPLKAGYLQKIVYLRKGTNLLVPETKANQKDANLVPMTVADAIKHGYMQDPTKTHKMDPIEEQLRDENSRLSETLKTMEQNQQELQLQLHKLKSQLTDAEAVAEFPVSVGTDSVVSPLEGEPVVNMALDADDDGLGDIVAEVNEPVIGSQDSDEDTQAALDALLGKTEE